jgi:hypothetical protein
MAFMVAALAGLSVALVVDAGPAAAHVCVRPVEVKVGDVSSITVGVPAEVQVVDKVAITIPAGFDLGQARAAGGWTSSIDGSTITYTGSTIAPLTCGYFTVTGTAASKGKLVFPVTTTAVDGTTTEYGPGKLGAQEVYAGIPAFPDAGGGSGLDATTIAGIVLVGGGLVAAAVLFAVRRRADRRASTAR